MAACLAEEIGTINRLLLSERVDTCILPRFSLLWWRLDVARRIGRRRRCICAGLGRGIRGRADNGAYRDACRDATPVRSAVVVAVAAAAAAADVHVPVRVDVRSPVRVDVSIASVRRVPMEVVAIEIALAVRAGGAVRTADGALPTTTRRPLTRPLATTTSTILNQDQSGVTGLDNCVDPLRKTVWREWHNRCSHGAARERQGGREQQC